MSEPLISVSNLSKNYRLYRKPSYRFLDVFGFLPRWVNGYQEHKALDNVSFQINPGEKIAVIGRNGAGKSTLLKMLGGVSHPTCGTVDVRGTITALLTLGTGFHQDFTGRENAAAYLAQLGLANAQVQRMLPSIVDFAELHEYFDQPLKTYSSGMQMRLAFSVSTIVQPEILILDEVLSVGDAYFFKKSYERIRDLCSAHGTTLIMVTHDLYSAMTMCERVIWMDEGRIRADGAAKLVVNAYEASIKEQEEARLRHKWRDTITQNQKEVARVLVGEIKTADGATVSEGMKISAIRLLRNEGCLSSISMLDEVPGAERGGIIVDPEAGSWGPVEEDDNRQVRTFVPFASVYHKLPFVSMDLSVLEAFDSGELVCEIDYKAITGQVFTFELREPEDRGSSKVGELMVEPGGWRTGRVALKGRDETPAIGIDFARYGKRTLEIKGVRFLDETEKECFQFRVGGVFRAEIDYLLNDANFDEYPTILIAFHKNGTLRTHRLYTNTTRIAASQGLQGTINVVADPIRFTAGTYLLNVAAFADGFFERGDTKKFFTVNDELYDMHSRAYEVTVLPEPNWKLAGDVVFMHDSDWSISPNSKLFRTQTDE
jgi:ABC-type polysaccharide/polyol phosphate transport system ATPase subunit